MPRLLPLLSLLAAAAAAASAAPSPPPPPPDVAVQPAPVSAAVVRDGDSWTVTYRLPRDARVWPFIRSSPVQDSGGSWRARSWTVLTPGVRIEQLGRYDALLAERGNVPREVRIGFRPFTEALVADYVPALTFSNGMVALFEDHFAIFSVASREVAASLPPDLTGQPIVDSGTRVSFRDTAGPFFHGGRHHGELTLRNSTSYVLFGADTRVSTSAMTAIIEPELPAWLADALREMTPRILAYHAAQLGPAPGGKPTIVASWAGPTPPQGVSMNGGTVSGMILMRFSGGGVLTENRQLRDIARWFIAHEGAHFWLGQAVRYDRSRDAWIMEGGADLLAIRAVQALDPEYDWRAKLNEAIVDCASLSRGRGIGSAEERGEHRAYYACGAVFALLVEHESGAPFSRFVRGLVDVNREDGVLTRAEWLAAARATTRDEALVAWIEQTIDHGHADPGQAITERLQLSGIKFERGPDGLPRLE